MESNPSPAESFNPADYYICFTWRITLAYTQKPKPTASSTRPKRYARATMELLGTDIEGALQSFNERFRKGKRRATVDEVISLEATGIAFTFELANPDYDRRLSPEQEATVVLPAPALAEVMIPLDRRYYPIPIPWTPKPIQ